MISPPSGTADTLAAFGPNCVPSSGLGGQLSEGRMAVNQGKKLASLILGSLLLLALALFGSPAQAFAADFPSKPPRLVVPFPPGGVVDILARGLAPKLGEQLGRQIIVDNLQSFRMIL